MTDRYIEFLVDLHGKSPRNLEDSICRVKDASAGFVLSWQIGAHAEAYLTSHKAFEHLDYIQNEILRQRDAHRANIATWVASPFQLALLAPVGEIVKSLSPEDRTWFRELPAGSGGLPPGTVPVPLTLET